MFTVPASAPTGCAVPLVLQVNGQISNSTVMPVARGSRNCTISGFTSEVSPPANPLSFAFGDVGVGKNSGGGDTTISAAGTFLAPGSYTVTGTGGKDVGPFSATLTIPSLPELTGPVSGNSVGRAAGMKITWTGGGSGTVTFVVTSGPDAFPTITATARCGAPASAGNFTIPPYVMLTLPASSNARFSFGTNAPNGTFTATGIEPGNFHAHIARVGGALKLQ